MPLNTDSDTPIKFPTPQYLTLNSWRKGVITLVDKSRLPKDALAEATNLFLYEDGQPALRPGVDWYGEAPGRTAIATSSSVSPSASRSPSASASPSASVSPSLSPSASRSPSASASPSASISASISPSSSMSPSSSASPSASQSMSPSASLSPSASQSISPSASVSASISPSISPSPSVGNWAAIDGFDYFDNSGTISLVAAAGGAIYRSLDDGATWTVCSGASYTSGTEVNMNQNNSYLYITSGLDPIIRYDGSTTLLQYSALSTPAAATVARTGLAASNFTYYYKISAVNKIGFSAVSPSVSQAVSLQRSGWDATTNYLTLTLPALQTGQDRYDIYMSDNDIDYFYLDSTTGTSYKDDGSAIVIPSTTQPLTNTTTGPLVQELTNIGERMYGVRDKDHPYRISFTGTGNFAGAFSNAYDGGYLDWQPGGKYRPISVQDYRDGKGTPLATIWCKSSDAQGCILQMSLDTLTVGDISITVPSAYRLPGSRGTPAPKSVINVLNDFMFYNSQGFYNLGSRAQYLNLLSTDESSANIRPTVRTISPAGESGIAATFFENKVYFSVPYGGASTNTYTAVYDTERKAWLPTAFTLGFSKFLHYTDTSGNRRLLALKPGDVKLSQISIGIKGDYGVAFESRLQTGLYSPSKDRFEFQYTEEGEVELSNPSGQVVVTLSGIDRTHGFIPIQSKPISTEATTTPYGWDSFLWGTILWDDTSLVTTTISESSVKRYFRVQKELNAIQWEVVTNSLDAGYTLRTLQTWGTDTQAGHPQSWRLT